MNTFSKRFVDLINEFPEERETIALLKDFVESGKHREMTLDHLVLRVQPRSIDSLVRILERLAYGGAIHRVYRVESPKSRGKIADFTSYAEIPDRVFDFQAGVDLEIKPTDLRVIYTFA